MWMWTFAVGRAIPFEEAEGGEKYYLECVANLTVV